MRIPHLLYHPTTEHRIELELSDIGKAMKIEHLAMWVRDLEGQREFYERYFGGKANDLYTNEAKGFSSYFITFQDGARLELMHTTGISAPGGDSLSQFTGLAHFAFQVGSESMVDDLAERLRIDGIRIVDGPRRTGDGYYECAALDPENNRIEITA